MHDIVKLSSKEMEMLGKKLTMLGLTSQVAMTKQTLDIYKFVISSDQGHFKEREQLRRYTHIYVIN